MRREKEVTNNFQINLKLGGPAQSKSHKNHIKSQTAKQKLHLFHGFMVRTAVRLTATK